MEVPPERWAQSEAWLLAGHLGVGGRHRAREPPPAEWKKPPSISGTRRLGSGSSPLGGNRKAHGCWHQAASCPAPDETCHTTADTRAPETTRTPGQAATGPRRTGHPCGVCERGSPSTTPADAHPPERTRGSLRGGRGGGALKGHFPGVTENTNRLDGSHSNASDTGLKTLTWPHMLELIDPDPCSFSKCSWSSCYLPGSVLGI